MGRTRTVYQPDRLGCGGEWVCEHRQPAITAMVAFRAATQGTPEVTDWWSNGGNQIAFGRGDRGFVVINRVPTTLTHTFQTQLPAGDYCEVMTRVNLRRCDWSVKDGGGLFFNRRWADATRSMLS
jgi:alpha-amylase